MHLSKWITSIVTTLLCSVSVVQAVNLPPVVQNPGDQTNYAFDSVALQIQAYDPEGGSLKYSAVDLPPGLKIHPDTGRISGTLLASAFQESIKQPREGSTFYHPIVTVIDNNNRKTSVAFEWLIYGPGPTVEWFTLVNTATNQVVPGYEAIYMGSTLVINLAEINASNITLVAGVWQASGLPPGSIRFQLNQNKNYRIENDPPFTLSGDQNGDYFRWNFQLNTWYTIRATPYKHDNADGIAGYYGEIKIKIVNIP